MEYAIAFYSYISGIPCRVNRGGVHLLHEGMGKKPIGDSALGIKIRLTGAPETWNLVSMSEVYKGAVHF